jgi:methionyl aminopeptidase
MITTKSNREIELMRKAGEIVFLAHEAVKKEIKPGVSTRYLDEVAHRFILDQGATPSFLGYNGFPASICASVNDVLVHGIPSGDVILKEGDIVAVDIGANYRGYHGDSAWTYPVGDISDEAKSLLKVTEASLFAGLEKVKAGNRLGDIGAAISGYIKPFGYGVPIEYTGHGIGSEMHEDPAIPNYGIEGKGIVLRKGMTLAIEPMVQLGTHRTETMDDDWTVKSLDRTLTAHFEHTVLVLEDGYEILTRTQEAYKH